MWIALIVCTVLCLSLVSATPVSLGDFDVHKYFAPSNDIKTDNSLSPRIVGGDEVIPHSYPSQVALYMVTDSILFCGGSLISKDWVLTAASCLAVQPDFIYVVIGDHNLTELEPPVIVLDSRTYVYHSDYDEDTFKNDVGLVKLPMEVAFTDNIQPAVLANGSERYDGDNGTIVGWGETEAVGLSYLLREVDVTVISNEECAEASDAYKEVIQPMHVCTSGAGIVGSCIGDFGGPLLVDGVQIGIASSVSKDCFQGLPSVFTRVNDYYDWIMDQIKDSVTPSDS